MRSNAITGAVPASESSVSRSRYVPDPDPHAALDHLEQSARRDLVHSPEQIARATDWWRYRLREELQSSGALSADSIRESDVHPRILNQLEPIVDSDQKPAEVFYASNGKEYELTSVRRALREDVATDVLGHLRMFADEAAEIAAQSDNPDDVSRALIAAQFAIRKAGASYRRSKDGTIADAIADEVERTDATDVVAATIHSPEIRNRFSEEEVLAAMTPEQRVHALHCALAFELHEVVSRINAGYYPAQNADGFADAVRRTTDAVLDRIRDEEAEAYVVPLAKATA